MLILLKNVAMKAISEIMTKKLLHKKYKGGEEGNGKTETSDIGIPGVV